MAISPQSQLIRGYYVYRKIEAFDQMYDGGQPLASSFCFFYEYVSSASIACEYAKRLRGLQPIPYITTCFNKWGVVSNNSNKGSTGIKIYEVANDTLLLTIFVLCEVIQHRMDYDPAITGSTIKTYAAAFLALARRLDNSPSPR